MRPRWGKTRTRRVSIEHDHDRAAGRGDEAPGVDDSQISVCGTARRRPGEDHFEDECRDRGHTVCVVCQELVAAMGFSE
jgi:hypothetical protein